MFLAAWAGCTPAALGADIFLPRGIVVDHGAGRVYWVNPGVSGPISYANVDGSDAGDLNPTGASIAFPKGLAIDPSAGRMYWINSAPVGGLIGYAGLDGSGGQDLPAAGAFANSPTSLAIANGELFWANEVTSSSPLIGFTKLDGSGGGLLPIAGAAASERPSGVAVDPVGQRLYWTDIGTISSTRLDGSDRQSLPVAGATISGPTDPAIDPTGRRIYWVKDAFDSTRPASISFASLDGSGGGDLQLEGAAETFAIGIDPVAGRIFWATDGASDQRVRSANLNGSDVKVLFPPSRVQPPVDTSLRAPVIDDAPPASTPLTEASFLYHAVDGNVTLACALDTSRASPCTGRSSYAHLALRRHCFTVREQRNGVNGPAAQACWTVVPLAQGCTASFHHGYFILSGAAALGRRRATFHATTDGTAGRIALLTRPAGRTPLRVAYRLDGSPLGAGARASLAFAQLDRNASHTLVVEIAAGGRHARITRRFRYVSYVSVACGARRVVGRIATRTVRLGGARVTITAQVPKQIRGTAKLRFFVSASPRHALRAAHFTFAGKTLKQHALNAALTAQQLKADGTQVMTIELVPARGHNVTLRIPFRTRSI
jgi:hypothetical protein